MHFHQELKKELAALAWHHAGVLRKLECGEEEHLPDRQLG